MALEAGATSHGKDEVGYEERVGPPKDDPENTPSREVRGAEDT